MMNSEEMITKAFWAAVKKTINKFREHPYYFFTESDITSYLYSCFYSRAFEVQDAENKRIYLAHREYPTNFRYHKTKLLDETFVPYELKEKSGSRGNYDFAILHPHFVANSKTVEDVVNKDIRLLIKRGEDKTSQEKVKELLYSVEFKYVIHNSHTFVDEINMDNRKLELSLASQSDCGVNLVFCNIQPHYLQEIYNSVQMSRVITIFIQSYYNKVRKKVTPKPVANAKLKAYMQHQQNQEIFNVPFWRAIDCR